jgi:hypothetical protein
MDLALRPSKECLDLLFSLIEPDPERREGSASHALCHDWFKSDAIAIQELLKINLVVAKDPTVLLSHNNHRDAEMMMPNNLNHHGGALLS